MKIIVLSVLFLVASVTSHVLLRNENDDVVGFFKCLQKVLNGGLKEANIPNHNPLWMKRNISIPLNVPGANGSFLLWDTFIKDIPSYDIVSAGVIHPSANLKNISFHLAYKQLRIDARYNASLTILGKTEKLAGVINITLVNFRINGDFQFSIQGPNKANITSASLKFVTDTPKFKISGLNNVIAPIVNGGFALILQVLINQGNSAAVSEGLRQKIVADWLAPNKTQRIDAMDKYCKKYLF